MSEQRQVFEDPDGALRRRAVDPMLEMLAHKMGRVEVSVDKMAEAVTKLAVVEERQASDRQALERAFVAIQKTDERCTAMFEKCIEKMEKTEGRVDVLEQAAPMQAQTSQWIMTAVWAVVVAAAMYAAKKLGIIT